MQKIASSKKLKGSFNTCISVLFIALFTMASYGQQNSELLDINKFPIIPTPQQISYGSAIIKFESVAIQNTNFTEEAAYLKNFFQENGIQEAKNGLEVFIEKEAIHSNSEAYSLVIDSTIRIKANTDKGIFYAMQSLKQLFRTTEGVGMLPTVDVLDWPVFKIRGFMHDTGRNFQSISQLKEQIEVLSLYKYNIFHWHLTDDPGWRLESKLYPELHSEKATLRGKGKFYTQEEFKDLIAFCKARKITVVPEFDIPGHTLAFRRGLHVKSMRDEKVLPTLLDLFDELVSLTSPEDMPYIHIGTDEVRNKEEYVDEDFILAIMDRIKFHNREIITWKEGIQIKSDSTSIKQLWAQHPPKDGHRFIDSRANYINHLDPFAGMARLFFQQPCRVPKGNELALGGILCTWPDNNVNEERDILRQNPIYPSMVFYSDAIWKGRAENKYEYWAKLPPIYSKEFNDFKEFEAKVLKHKDLFFEGKEFPYLKQTNILWNVIGPFDHDGNFSKVFPVEKEIKKSYTIDHKKWGWSAPMAGGTIHLKHFFDFPALTDKKSGTYYALTEIYAPEAKVQDFWIGFQGWSRSGGRRVGPTPKIGEWHYTQPKIWVNQLEIVPPIWQQPGIGTKSDEIPFIDEDYFYRTPTKIALKKGWNTVLLKIPHGGDSWKWMFTCVPVEISNISVESNLDLRYKVKFN
tara:strand:- start:32642 stop:34702 length:2061 start_codon:yes stop_codon:yes gene_type:complete